MLFCTVIFVTYLSNCISYFLAGTKPILIPDVFFVTSIFSVTATFSSFPSTVIVFEIAFELFSSATPSFLYPVTLYAVVSYSNITRYSPFSTFVKA